MNILVRTLKWRSFVLAVPIALATSANASTIFNSNLGTAGSFAVLAGSTVTNTGTTNVTGDLGVWPGADITGLPGGVNGAVHNSDTVASDAQADLTAAYVSAAGAPCSNDFSGINLGGLTLTPGVYCFASSAQLTGTLTLNALGDPNAIFLFQIASALDAATNSSVIFTNGGQGGSVFWQVGSSATLGTTTAFSGNILALTSITLDTGATIGCGRALAQNGAVTMDSNTVSIASAGCLATSDTISAPEPSTAWLFAAGLLLSLVPYIRRAKERVTFKA
jgi:Ice-binding-like